MILRHNTIVFVNGMHRSGTSALSGTLNLLGAEIGNDVMGPAEDNPKGFFEPQSVVRLNNRILGSIGATWDRLPTYVEGAGFSVADHLEWCRSTFSAEIEQTFAEQFGSIQGPVVLKDPRICLLLPLWEEAAQKAGRDVKHLFIVRDPSGVARSLRRRNGLGVSQSEEFWVRYNLSALKHLPEGTPIVRFGQLMARPVATLETAGITVPPETAEDIRKFIFKPPVPRHELFEPRPASRSMPVRLIFSAIGDGNTLPARTEREGALSRIENIARMSDELTGNVYRLGEARPSVPGPVHGERTVIYHCHLFKNAGTSVDHMLKQHFAALWNEQEFPSLDSQNNSDLVLSHIQAHTRFQVFSSHTGNWFLDYDVEKLRVLPIIFLRHPLLRIRSAYQFEARQTVETQGSALARTVDMAGYIETRLERQFDYALSNFQARRMAFFVGRRIVDVERQAMEAFERLPFIGRVEDFPGSAERLRAYLRPYFPDFDAETVQKNITTGEVDSVADRVEAMRAEIGHDLMERLIAANRIDLQLYDALEARYNSVMHPAA
ncbi:MAG: sulfotransferase family 2 domain-containing protein [Pseudomonadota bacterium]